MPKAMLIRIGNDENCDADRIMNDSTFDFIPITEDDDNLIESITYDTMQSRVHMGKYLSDAIPHLKGKKCHLDPYFPNYYKHKQFEKPTYCDPGAIKSEFLKTLNKEDLLVFYWGVKKESKKELFIIGYIVVERIVDLSLCTDVEIDALRERYFSAHLVRQSPEGVLVIGSEGMLLKKPICLTDGIKKGSTNYAIKEKYAESLGINELQSSSFFVKVLIQEEYENMKKLLKNDY